VVGSQIGSLTPGPFFAHNLGDRCPNGQFEAIFDIYASRPFQWPQEHPNARCFAPYCRALNIRESRRTLNPHFFQVLGFTPTLGQSRVAIVEALPFNPCAYMIQAHIFGQRVWDKLWCYWDYLECTFLGMFPHLRAWVELSLLILFNNFFSLGFYKSLGTYCD
jgi:hypothetical protein